MEVNQITARMSNPEIVMELGRRFKEYRLAHRLTQKEAAQGAGVSCSHLWGRLFGSMQLSQKGGCIFSPGRWVL